MKHDDMWKKLQQVEADEQVKKRVYMNITSKKHHVKKRTPQFVAVAALFVTCCLIWLTIINPESTMPPQANATTIDVLYSMDAPKEEWSLPPSKLLYTGLEKIDDEQLIHLLERMMKGQLQGDTVAPERKEATLAEMYLYAVGRTATTNEVFAISDTKIYHLNTGKLYHLSEGDIDIFSLLLMPNHRIIWIWVLYILPMWMLQWWINRQYKRMNRPRFDDKRAYPRVSKVQYYTHKTLLIAPLILLFGLLFYTDLAPQSKLLFLLACCICVPIAYWLLLRMCRDEMDKRYETIQFVGIVLASLLLVFTIL